MAAMPAACGIREAAALLGVPFTAGRPEVESAFRRRALRCHPDRHPKDALAKVRFLRLSKAKEVLLQALKDHPGQSGRRQEAARATNEWRAKPKDKSAQASAANAKRRAEQQKKEAELKQREAEAKLRKEKEQKEKEEAAKRRAAFMAEELRRERMATAERRRDEIFEVFRKKKMSKTSKSEADTAQSSAQTAPCRSPPEASERFQPGFQLSDKHKKALQRLEKQRQGEIPKPIGSWWVVDSEADKFLKREALQGNVP